MIIGPSTDIRKMSEICTLTKTLSADDLWISERHQKDVRNLSADKDPPGKGISARLHKAYPRRSIRYPPWNIRGLTLFDYMRTSEGYPSPFIRRISVTVYPKDIREISSPDFAHIGMRTHEHTRVCSCVRHFLVFLTIHEIHTILFHSIC